MDAHPQRVRLDASDRTIVVRLAGFQFLPHPADDRMESFEQLAHDNRRKILFRFYDRIGRGTRRWSGGGGFSVKVTAAFPLGPAAGCAGSLSPPEHAANGLGLERECGASCRPS